MTKFDERGFTVTPDAGDWEWGLELQGFGEVTGVQHEGGKLSYERGGGLTEWFVNDSRGLEQGWTLDKRIGSKDSEEPLRLQFGIRGQLSPQVADGGLQVSFQDESGATALTYGGLKAWDAERKVVPVRFVITGGENLPVRLIVEVDDRHASYPITIDPIAQQKAYLKASNTDSGDYFGRSVAVSGDTVVVGALGESSNATGVNGNQADNSASYSGAAYVFVRDGTNWSQQAYLKASNTDVGDHFGRSVAVSGDTVVVGAFGETSNTTGVDGNQAEAFDQLKAELDADQQRFQDSGFRRDQHDPSCFSNSVKKLLNMIGPKSDEAELFDRQTIELAHCFIWWIYKHRDDKDIANLPSKADLNKCLPEHPSNIDVPYREGVCSFPRDRAKLYNAVGLSELKKGSGRKRGSSTTSGHGKIDELGHDLPKGFSI